MSINSRAKGASGEREFSRVLHDYLGVRLVRNLEQSRRGGHDLGVVDLDNPVGLALDRYAIECKRYASITPAMLAKFWNQAERQAHQAERVPALAYRADRQEWRVILPLSAFNPAFPWESFSFTADVGVDAFAAVVRESAEVSP